MAKAPIESTEKSLSPSRTVGFSYYYYAIIFVVLEAVFVLLIIFGNYLRSMAYIYFIGVSIGLIYAYILIRYMLLKKEESAL